MVCSEVAKVREVTEEEISGRLLQYLRGVFQSASLRYSEGPTRITGGFETSVFGFKLNGAPESLSGPLIIRIFDKSEPSERARLEATVHNTLVKLGYPAPLVWVTETDRQVLDGTFLIMERIGGHTLAAGFEGVGQGRGLGELVRLLIRAPKMVREMARAMADAQYRLHRLPVEPLIRALKAEGLPVSAITFSGRLERLRLQTDRVALAELRPGAVWLLEHRAAELTPLSICHCDLQPFNILTEEGSLRGVLDWGNVALASPEMDVGSSIANMATVPVHVPRALRGIFRVLINANARLYHRAYRRLRVIDDGAVRYYQVFRSMCQLVRVADGFHYGRANLGIYGSAAGVGRLTSHIRSLTGLNLNLNIFTPNGDADRKKRPAD